MNRFTSLLILASVALACAITAAQDHEAPATQPDFKGLPAAKNAADRFQVLERAAEQRYDADIEQARRQYLNVLKPEQIQQTRKHNPELAQELADVIQQLEAESADYKKGVKSGPAGNKAMSIDLGNGIEMKFVRIPSGEFMMGSPNTEPGRGADETQHQVTLTRAFFMSATPVTQAQYAAVTGANPSRFKGDDLPVENVSWAMSVEYCKKLSQKAGRTCRIPTEAEWEYAAHAGTQGAYSFGGNPAMLGDNAWIGANSGGHTHPVGTKPPNAWGLYDMHGNVWQICNDFYDPYPPGDATDPTGPAGGAFHMNKGGAWDTANPTHCRIAMRLYRNFPGHYNANIGIRVVAEIQ